MNRCDPDVEERERARAAARGQADWGRHGSSDEHRRYVQPVSTTSRRRCSCGCGQRATHLGMTNGVALTAGCEMSMWRWASRGLG